MWLKCKKLFVILHAYILERNRVRTRGSMIKKIDILGLQVDNYTVRESIMQLDTYMSNAELNIIETVTMKQLLMSLENPFIKECLLEVDLTIIGEREILSDLDNTSVQRLREIRDNDFMYELLKRAVRNQKKIFLIALSDAEILHMHEFFLTNWPKLRIEGSYALEECTGDMDTVVNEINAATPDIVLSSIEMPFEEEFILQHKDKISASVWYGVGRYYDKKPGSIHLVDAVARAAMRGRLHHAAAKYKKEHKEAE